MLQWMLPEEQAYYDRKFLHSLDTWFPIHLAVGSQLWKLLYYRDPHIFQKCRSYPQILGTRKVKRSDQTSGCWQPAVKIVVTKHLAVGSQLWKLLYYRDPLIFQKCRSYPQILGTRKVKRSESKNKDSTVMDWPVGLTVTWQFLPCACELIYIFVCQRVKKNAKLTHEVPLYKI